MPDKVELRIQDYRYDRFKSYSVSSDIYLAADAFEFELVRTPGGFRPEAGMECRFFVNGRQELVGLLDKVSSGYDSSGRYFKIAGRDMMGILVDSYCEKFKTVRNIDLIKIAEELIAPFPFYKEHRTIEYDEVAKKRDKAKPIIQIEPGQQVFELLKELAQSRGLVFYSTASGHLVFRCPKGRGRTLFTIVRSDTPNTYIEKGELVNDIANRYTKYTVLTQSPGGDDDMPSQINSIVSIEDKEFPFRDRIYKPFVESVDDDTESPKRRAQFHLEQRRSQSRTVSYTVMGHSQRTRNWTIDELVRVDDDELDIHEELLVYGRTFTGSTSGQRTDLRLGIGGLLE